MFYLDKKPEKRAREHGWVRDEKEEMIIGMHCVALTHCMKANELKARIALVKNVLTKHKVIVKECNNLASALKNNDVRIKDWFKLQKEFYNQFCKCKKTCRGR